MVNHLHDGASVALLIITRQQYGTRPLGVLVYYVHDILNPLEELFCWTKEPSAMPLINILWAYGV